MSKPSKTPTFEEWVFDVDKMCMNVAMICAAEISDYSLEDMRSIYDDGVRTGRSLSGMYNMFDPYEFALYFIEKLGLNKYDHEPEHAEILGVKAWELELTEDGDA